MKVDLESSLLRASVEANDDGVFLTVTDKATGTRPLQGSGLLFSPTGPVDPGKLNIQSGGAYELPDTETTGSPRRVDLARFQDGAIDGVRMTHASGPLTIVERLWLDPARPTLRASVVMTNIGSQNTTVHGARRRLNGIRSGKQENDEWIFPATYSNNVYTHGRIAALRDEGVAFSFTPIGLYLPYAIVYDPFGRRGILCATWTDMRFSLLLRPDPATGTSTLSTLMTIERVLFPGESIACGDWEITLFAGHYYDAMEQFRTQNAIERGFSCPADAPAFLPDLIMANLSFNFEDLWHGFASAEVDDFLGTVSRLGVNCLYVNGQWRSGLHHTRSEQPEWRNSCIILPAGGLYSPEEDYGGIPGHRDFLEGVHRRGMRAIAWITTSGLGFESDEVRDHPEWFLHDEDGELHASFRSEKVKHIADANFFSPGWRRWFLRNVEHLVELGYDGIFLDGIVPKRPDAWAYPWPGRVQNGAIDQVRTLRQELKRIAPDFLFVAEDCGCYWNMLAEVSLDRYHLRVPAWPPAREDTDAVCAIPLNDGSRPRISALEILDYLRIGQLSLLPGAKVLAYDLKYHGRASFPWMYYGVLADLIPVVFYKDRMTYEEENIYRLSREERQDARLESRFYDELEAALALRRDRVELRRAPLHFDALHVEPAGIVGFARPYEGRLTLVFINFLAEAAHIAARFVDPWALGIKTSKVLQLRILMPSEENGSRVFDWKPGEAAALPSIPIGGYGASVLSVE